MKKHKKALIISLSITFLTLLLFRFRNEIASIFPLSANTHIETNTKVQRKRSYIGRLQEAERLIHNQYYTLANIEIKKAIEEKPELVEPYLILAEMHIQQEHKEQLQALIKKIQELFPNNPAIQILEVKSLILQNKFEETKNILSQENLSPHLRFYKALLFALQNDHKTAEKIVRSLEKVKVQTQKFEVKKDGIQNIEKNVLEESMSLELAQKVKEISIIYEEFDELSDGKQPHLLALISKSLSDNNELHLARKFAETAIQEDAQYIDAWILKGYSEYLLQNYASALLDLKKAYELDTIRAETHYFLALTLEKLGQNTEAALFFEKALENNFQFSVEIKWKLVDIFLKQKKYDQVITLYKEIIAENPAPEVFIPVIHNAIDILRKPEIALEITEQLLENNPEDETALNLYGWALISNKKLDQAEKVLQKAENLNDKNPRTLLNLGLLAEKRQKFTKAIELYRQSYLLAKEIPNSPLTNIAADRYNQLIELDKPEVQEETRKPNSP